jgi:DNA-binding Lrp family transcriptional regulator
MTLDPIELSLIDRWQRNFPLVSSPFEAIGRSAGLDERTVIETFDRLQREQVLTRIGAVVRPHTAGASTLAAMRVSPERLDEVAAIVSREPLVTHNYERAHEYNLWFVVAGPNSTKVKNTIESIRNRCATAVLNLPMERAYHLDLGFSLLGGLNSRSSSTEADYQADTIDQKLLAAIENGLPMVARPYRDVAAGLGCSEAEVIGRLRRLAAAGVVTRFGCVVRHRTLGYSANAMAVWDVPAARTDDAAARLVQNPLVTLCYRRSRWLPEWAFNLYCMVHAKSRRDGLAVIDELNATAGLTGVPQAVLFSTRCFKQRGAVFSSEDRRMH